MQIVVTDTCGKLVFTRPMWLIVIGNRRHQLSPKSVWEAYHQRYDVEHFFRFGKQHLLTTAYQTPDVNHEENWWQMTQSPQLFVQNPVEPEKETHIEQN